MLWSVYKIENGGQWRKPLGRIRARHQPEATEKAWKKWPREKDPNQVQAGFHIVPYRQDPFELGVKSRK